MSTLHQRRKGPGSNTGNPGHFAATNHSPSPVALSRTQEQLVSLIEDCLPDDIEICAAGDVEEQWPVDSGDFSPATHSDVSDFAENLLNSPGWETDVQTFAAAIPDDYLVCTRSFDAWSYGTMGPNDFQPVKDDQDYVNELHQKFVNHTKK